MKLETQLRIFYLKKWTTPQQSYEVSKGFKKPVSIGRGHVVSPSKLTPSSFFTPQQSCEEFFWLKDAKIGYDINKIFDNEITIYNVKDKL